VAQPSAKIALRSGPSLAAAGPQGGARPFDARMPLLECSRRRKAGRAWCWSAGRAPSGVVQSGTALADLADLAYCPEWGSCRSRPGVWGGSRLKFEEFDFSYYNRTHFAGLENGIRNCYVNSLLQVLYFIPWLRVEVLKHICDAEFCLTCELGFLFHMLRIGARSTVCQASNLLRSLKQIREASALGLLEEPQVAEGPAPSGNVLGRRIQSFGRFMLEQSTKEMASAQAGLHDPNHLSAPARLFGSDVRTCTKCNVGRQREVCGLRARCNVGKTEGCGLRARCNVGTTETARESRSLHFDLHYPSHRDRGGQHWRGRREQQGGAAAELLQAARAEPGPELGHARVV
ncbi:hypothetical protein CYMTET_33129, partial [Cymbomonas tetramitiformis]